jgi:O-antigen/teichoic acid export membrane protein
LSALALRDGCSTNLASAETTRTEEMGVQQQPLDTFSTEHLHADLKGRSVRGGMLTLTSQGAQFLMQTVSTIVLARLLTPADFGLVAMVSAITNMGQSFADLGLSEATIQRPEISHEQVSTLFWINVGIGCGLTALASALAPVLAWFYREPRLIHITLLMSLTFLIGGLRVQHDALLRRQMRFSALAVRDITAYAIAVPFAIILAWRGFGYWAIVALPLTLNLTQMTLSWVMARWVPGLPRRNTSVRSLIAFGGSVAASYLVFNVNRSADSILIGWHWGAGPLGLYSRAYNLLMLPVRQLGAPARSVAIPAFSRVQADPERLARYYLRTANLIMWIIAPIFGFLFVAALPVIVLTLGHRWQGAAPVFQILAIFALGQLLFESTLWLLVSRGQSQRMLKLLLMISPIIIGGYAIGLPFGIKGVALSGSLVLLGVFPWVLKFSFRGTGLTLQRLGRGILYPVFVCVSGIVVSELALHLISYGGIGSQLAVTALGFAAGLSLSMLIPAVREELMSLTVLFSKSRSASLAELAETAS